MPPRIPPSPPLLGLLAVLVACGDGDGGGVPPGGPSTGPPTGPGGELAARGRPERSADPRAVQARAALDGGRLDLAAALVEQALPLVGEEGPLLRARLHALAGRDFEALAAIEKARRATPSDPRVYATAAELHAAAGRLTEADNEIRRGVEVAGVSPELVRARGVHLICTPGQARHGLALLERALGEDPELPFTARALGQAYLLVARERARAGDPRAALESVRRSLEHDPEDLQARRTEADLLLAVGSWGEAIQRYEALLAEGLPLEAELAVNCKNAGLWAAVKRGDRPLALAYYRRALELGLLREELGHGRVLLEEEADGRVEAAVHKLAARDREGALADLEAALADDPERLDAWNYRGHAHHELGQFAEAEDAWERVVTEARLRGVELPDPVHLQLARVQAVDLGRFDQARATLQAYLDLEPTGRWVERTRALLAGLPE